MWKRTNTNTTTTIFTHTHTHTHTHTERRNKNAIWVARGRYRECLYLFILSVDSRLVLTRKLMRLGRNLENVYLVSGSGSAQGDYAVRQTLSTTWSWSAQAYMDGRAHSPCVRTSHPSQSPHILTTRVFCIQHTLSRRDVVITSAEPPRHHI